MTPDDKYRPSEHMAAHPHFVRGREYERQVITEQLEYVIAECDDDGCQVCLVIRHIINELNETGLAFKEANDE